MAARGRNSSGEPAALSAALRSQLADVGELTTELVDAAAPLLTALRAGAYLITLANLALELVTERNESWFTRRYADRGLTDAESDWPGTAHFQLRDRLPGPIPAFASVLPTRSLHDLDPAVVAAHTEAISSGRRPAAVLMTWAEQRYVEAEHAERCLMNVVLDGHHKLVAYASAGIPARALLVSGVVGSDTRLLEDLVAPLRITE